MSVMAAPAPLKPKEWTYADYLALPDDDDGIRYEILDGELIQMDSPIPTHQEIVGAIFATMRQFVLENGLGKVYTAPLDVVFAPKTVTQPDVIFVSNERNAIITDKNITGAPDLVVEVVSQSTQRKDRTRKFNLYARYGVREYWIVDRDAEGVDVFVLDNGQYREVASEAGQARSEILAGFTITLRELFA